MLPAAAAGTPPPPPGHLEVQLDGRVVGHASEAAAAAIVSRLRMLKAAAYGGGGSGGSVGGGLGGGEDDGGAARKAAGAIAVRSVFWVGGAGFAAAYGKPLALDASSQPPPSLPHHRRRSQHPPPKKTPQNTQSRDQACEALVPAHTEVFSTPHQPGAPYGGVYVFTQVMGIQERGREGERERRQRKGEGAFSPPCCLSLLITANSTATTTPR